jgi:hypothetical protein
MPIQSTRPPPPITVPFTPSRTGRLADKAIAQAFPWLPAELQETLAGIAQSFMGRPGRADGVQQQGAGVLSLPSENRFQGDIRQWNKIVDGQLAKHPDMARWALKYKGLGPNREGLAASELLKDLGLMDREPWDPSQFVGRVPSSTLGHSPVVPGPAAIPPTRSNVGWDGLRRMGFGLKNLFVALPRNDQSSLRLALQELLFLKPSFADGVQSHPLQMPSFLATILDLTPTPAETATRAILRWNHTLAQNQRRVPELKQWRLAVPGQPRGKNELSVTELVSRLGMPPAEIR